MESIFNFLADNYIYFMIAAGILAIALIGFLIDGKKKQKKEEIAGVPTMQAMNTQNTVQPTVAQTQTEQPNAQVVNEELVAEPTLTFDEPANQVEPESIFNIPEPTNAPTIGEPITMPATQEVVSEPVQEPIVEPVNIAQPVQTSQVNEPVIDSAPVVDVPEVTPVENNASEPVVPVVEEPVINEPVAIQQVEIPEIMPTEQIVNNEETFIAPATQMPEVPAQPVVQNLENNENQNNTNPLV
ncbi:MAG: hypothetical protein IJB83_01375 [Bacilli bacterium]|nr:hypothetical protein [Bacilli bacterium]